MPRFQVQLLWLLFCTSFAAAQNPPIRIEYRDGGVHAKLSKNGFSKSFLIATNLPQFGQRSFVVRPTIKENSIGTAQHVYYLGKECTIVNTVTELPDGLRWDVEIQGLGDEPWSLPIETQLAWEGGAPPQFWTTWADDQADPERSTWSDPFVAAPFRDLEMVYGGESHWSRNAFTAPVACSFFPENDLGVSFVQSLNDTILDLKMQTSASGSISYLHENHRISSKNTVRISHRIVVHEADWRAAMRWLRGEFPQFFYPKEPLVQEVGGCGAYSAFEGEFDAERFRKMGFSFNWKASFDFPYMGMFIPPVGSDDEEWVKFSPSGKTEMSSIRQLRNYSAQFRKNGFHTLSYFNVTEFGNRIVFPWRQPPDASAQAWKNANDFLYHKLKSGLLRPPKPQPDWDERPIFSNWEDCVVMDPGDSTYQAFLLEQARLHLEKIPTSSGICIDRLDWLRFYNSAGDDGVSLVEGRKVRSLIFSWNDIMGKIGGTMHGSHKVIFSNPLYRRLDLMREIDGIYDEYGNYYTSLNLCAQLAFNKPITAWTTGAWDFLPNPDAYFQHHLYLGAFLTVPFPGNDHTITPDAAIEPFYLDYGPLLTAIKGREWLLEPHAIEVRGGNAKANIFKVKGGIVIPVIHAGKEAVKLALRLPPDVLKKEKIRVQVLYPGAADWQFWGELKFAETMELEVKTQRGCALVKLE